MKTIQPVKVWNNGVEVNATILDVSIMYDNLKDSATFSYRLMNAEGASQPFMPFTALVNGTKIIDGEAYDAWDSNDYAYNWIAQQLNLTITGEYVPPVPPNPVVPAEPTTTTTTTIS